MYNYYGYICTQVIGELWKLSARANYIDDYWLDGNWLETNKTFKELSEE